MQQDEVIWEVIRHGHCSFMAKCETEIFCRNPYNVTGKCNRSSCPLANSRCATVLDRDGVFYLYMKTIERAHMPNKLWERIKLPRNLERSLEIIDKHMLYWPKRKVYDTKKKLLKLMDTRKRMAKLTLKTREKIMTVPTKEKKREARREEKAEKAALVQKSIEKELVERLVKGVYGDMYDFDYPVYDMKEESLDYEDPEIEYVEGFEELEEDDMEDFVGLSVRDDEDSDEEMADGVDDLDRKTSAFEHCKKRSEWEPTSKKKAKMLVEVEHEDTRRQKRAVL